jgi:ABC-type nitrate/sulfonate/bicarbonate transport system substrate-binding protein
MRRFIIAAVAAAITLIPASAMAHASQVTTLTPGQLRVCLYPGFAPFAIQGKDGWSGWDVKYLKGFAKQQGLTLTPVYVSAYEDIWMRPAKNECDLAATGISLTAARVAQTGNAVSWTDPYYYVERALIVRKGTKINTIADLAGKTVLTTRGSLADIDLLARLQKAGITSTKVEYVSMEQKAARRVANARSGGPIAYAGGAGSISYLSKEISGLTTAWPHCAMLADGTISSEPFSFPVRTASTGLAQALNAYVKTPTVPYPGGLGSGRDCPNSN